MTKKLIIFYGFLAIFIIFLGISATKSPAENPQKIGGNIEKILPVEECKEILINPHDEVKQGETIFITIESPKKLESPVFFFQGKKYKIFERGDNKYEGYLGINALEKPGQYKISMSDETKYLNDKTYISVIKEDFPKQNLRVTSSMAGLTSTPHERAQVGSGIRMFTPVNLRKSEPPYENPTEGCINSPFGLKRYYNGEFSGNYHKGIDIKADAGTPVKAITDGKVTVAENFRLHGTTVIIDHGQGIVSLYIHLSKLDVKPGEYVEAGQKIGEVGSTGFATGPHLHWGLYVHGVTVNPMNGWMKPHDVCFIQ